VPVWKFSLQQRGNVLSGEVRENMTEGNVQEM